MLHEAILLGPLLCGSFHKGVGLFRLLMMSAVGAGKFFQNIVTKQGNGNDCMFSTAFASVRVLSRHPAKNYFLSACRSSPNDAIRQSWSNGIGHRVIAWSLYPYAMLGGARSFWLPPSVLPSNIESYAWGSIIQWGSHKPTLVTYSDTWETFHVGRCPLKQLESCLVQMTISPASIFRKSLGKGHMETSVFVTKYERTSADKIASCSYVLLLRTDLHTACVQQKSIELYCRVQFQRFHTLWPILCVWIGCHYC